MRARASFAAACACALATSAHALTINELAGQPACAALEAAAPGASAEEAERIEIARFACRAPIDVSVAQAEALLGRSFTTMRRDGEALLVLLRADGASASLTGSLKGAMERIGESNLWAARYRLAELDRAMIIAVPTVDGALLDDDHWLRWRGPNAIPAHVFEPALDGQVIERTLYSQSLGETRRLQIYLPSGHDVARSYPALFIADGASAGVYARQIEPMIEAGLLPPMVIVGSLSAQRGIVEDRSGLNVDIRAADYLPNYVNGGDRFERHMLFL